jgi:hypothetical protein
MTDEWEKQEGLSMWLPEKEGEELIGKVLDIVEGAYGVQYILETDKGVVRTPSHKVLQSRMAKVKKGDTIKIVFSGSEPPSVKGQNPTKLYEVYKKK